MKLTFWQVVVILSIVFTSNPAEERHHPSTTNQKDDIGTRDNDKSPNSEQTRLDRRKFSLFTRNLNIFKHTQSTAATKTIAAFNTLRFYNMLQGEYLRSIALTQLNRLGLTPAKLEEVARTGRAYHRVNQFINRYSRYPERLQNPKPSDIRLTREIIRIYDSYLTPAQKAELKKKLNDKNISLEHLRTIIAGATRKRSVRRTRRQPKEAE